MGLWNFISKGVTVEKRERKVAVAEEVAVQLESDVEEVIATEEEAAVDEQPLDLTSADYASSILFENPQPNPYGNAFQNVFAGAGMANRNILVVTPLTERDEVNIVEHLRSTNEAVIVCFEGLSVADAHKRLNFLRGVACALRGSIRPLDKNKVIITPSGVGVKK